MGSNLRLKASSSNAVVLPNLTVTTLGRNYAGRRKNIMIDSYKCGECVISWALTGCCTNEIDMSRRAVPCPKQCVLYLGDLASLTVSKRNQAMPS